MKRKIRSKRRLLTPRTILCLPDLEVAKSAVLNSPSCPDAQRGWPRSHYPRPRLGAGSPR